MLTSAASISTPVPDRPSRSLVDEHQEKLANGDNDDDRERNTQKFGKRTLGEGDIQLDKKKLEEAIREEKKRKSRADGDDESGWGKKKKYNSSLSGGKDGQEVTEEELGGSLYLSGITPTLLIQCELS